MPAPCPPGFVEHIPLQSPFSDSTTRDGNGTYTRKRYEWVLANNAVSPFAPCGVQATWNMTYGTSSDGSVSVQPFGIGGSTGAGTLQTTELSVNVGPDEFDYIGYQMVLKETTETGSYTESGGFQNPNAGVLDDIRFFFRILRYGIAGMIPSVEYDEPSSTSEKYVLAAWAVCKRRCNRQAETAAGHAGGLKAVHTNVTKNAPGEGGVPAEAAAKKYLFVQTSVHESKWGGSTDIIELKVTYDGKLARGHFQCPKPETNTSSQAYEFAFELPADFDRTKVTKVELTTRGDDLLILRAIVVQVVEPGSSRRTIASSFSPPRLSLSTDSSDNVVGPGSATREIPLEGSP